MLEILSKGNEKGERIRRKEEKESGGGRSEPAEKDPGKQVFNIKYMEE